MVVVFVVFVMGVLFVMDVLKLVVGVVDVMMVLVVIGFRCLFMKGDVLLGLVLVVISVKLLDLVVV